MKTYGKMQMTTPSDREIAMTREFDAPRALIWDCWTKPELVSRWLLGPDGWSFAVCDMDLRAGGTYRWVWQRDASGERMGMGGVFREVTPPQRLVATEAFDEPWYQGEAIVTTIFSELDGGRTRVTQTMLLESKEARDGVLQSGMETGVERSYERLEQEVLPELTAAKA